MYNGVGLQTARGTGTSAHVQRNIAALRRPRKRETRAPSVRHKVSAATEEHERRRRIEVEVYELADRLHAEGKAAADIDAEKKMLRDKLLKDLLAPRDVMINEVATQQINATQSTNNAVLTAAERMRARNNRVRSAFGLPGNYEEGSSFRGKDMPTAHSDDNVKLPSAERTRLPDNKVDQPELSESSSSLSSSSGMETGSGSLTRRDDSFYQRDINVAPSHRRPSLVEGRRARRGLPNPAESWVRNHGGVSSSPDNVKRSLAEVHRRRFNLRKSLDAEQSHRAVLVQGPSSNSVKQSLEAVHRRRMGLPPAHEQQLDRVTRDRVVLTDLRNAAARGMEEVRRRRAQEKPLSGTDRYRTHSPEMPRMSTDKQLRELRAHWWESGRSFSGEEHKRSLSRPRSKSPSLGSRRRLSERNRLSRSKRRRLERAPSHNLSPASPDPLQSDSRWRDESEESSEHRPRYRRRSSSLSEARSRERRRGRSRSRDRDRGSARSRDRDHSRERSWSHDRSGSRRSRLSRSRFRSPARHRGRDQNSFRDLGVDREQLHERGHARSASHSESRSRSRNRGRSRGHRRRGGRRSGSDSVERYRRRRSQRRARYERARSSSLSSLGSRGGCRSSSSSASLRNRSERQSSPDRDGRQLRKIGLLDVGMHGATGAHKVDGRHN